MRNARVEEPRAWSDVTRQTRATRGTRRLNPRMTPRGKDRRGASKGASGTERMIHARTPTRERDLRENGDTRATRAAVPLQLNHSKPPPLVEFPPLALHAAPNPPVDPLRRPLTTLSLSLSLSSLSSLLFPSYCTSIILLPPFHRSQISLFFYRYSHFCHPCRSSVCWFVRPFVHSVIGPARIFVRFFSSLREIDEFPYPREYHSPSGKHRRQFLWEESRRDHRLPYGEYDFDRGCLVEAREIVLGTLIKLEAPS